MLKTNGFHQKTLGISFISSFLPRQCGIATFTNDLATSISKVSRNENIITNIAALNDIPEGYKYPSDVKFEIKDKKINDFKEAAYYLNLSDSDVINIQHEFGLYGGDAGANILYLIENLNKPLVTTLHTILEKPSPDEMKVIKEIAAHSSYLVVQSERAVMMMHNIYGIHPDKVRFIPHGAPEVQFLDTSYYKDKFRLSDKKVILTFGLLGPGKGLEDVITALAEVVKTYPDVVYIILGATHPNVKRQFGETYRISLENLVKKYDLENNVMFINRFVDTKELHEFLLMSDIYVSPYHNKAQIVSGTLTYAMACGKAVVSTPYWYAEESLKNERGILFPFKDSKFLATTLLELLQNESLRNRLRKNAYDATRKLTWNNVAKNYIDVFTRAIVEYKTNTYSGTASKYRALPALPEINFNHLENLTDSTGILQHATYSIGNPAEGYCTDDNVRALLITVMHKLIFNDDKVSKLINIYLRFVYYSFNKEKGLFRNFMSYERKWLEEAGSEDSNGRVIFSLGYIIKNMDSNSIVGLSKSLFDESIQNMKDFKSPRTIAYMILGSVFYLSKFSGALDIKKIFNNKCEELYNCYLKYKDEDWNWYEDSLSYSNARLPHALLMAGQFKNNKKYITAGLESLEWLYEQLLDDSRKFISLIGNDGWLVKGQPKARFDQQPVEIPPLMDACYQAYLITKNPEWISRVNMAFSWFLGNNERQEPICDFATGGCYDGLTSTMFNQNQGAESTLSWLLALLRMTKINQELKMS
ncbi:MAG: glycosyltransferase family 4 protein [Bacteroidetes bacterium]|nr:glycosyltransferase family 4 protein [Bacteroidota bacterium]